MRAKRIRQKIVTSLFENMGAAEKGLGWANPS
jgi:hypothetical protein